MPTPARRMAQGRGSGPMWASAPTISRLFEIYPAGLFLQHSLDQLRNVSTRRPPCGWPHGAPKRLFHLLGRTKFARHQGFARRAKRLYARCAPRGGVRISPQINAAGLLLQHGLDQLRNVRARRPPCGWPHGAPKRLFHLLGRTEFARHQGFAHRAKRLYARRAPRGGGRTYFTADQFRWPFSPAWS